MAATPGESSPSVARSLSALEVDSLRAIALALPAGWIVQVTGPHGQLSMLPRRYAHAFHRAHAADRELGCVYAMNGLHGIRVPQ